MQKKSPPSNRPERSAGPSHQVPGGLSNSSKRGQAVRDISSKKQKEEEAFKVRHIQQDREIPMMASEPTQEMSEMTVPNEEGTSVFDEDSQILPSDRPERSEGPSHQVPGGLSTNQKEYFQKQQEPKELVKVKFAKFVQLVTARDCSEVIAAHEDTDIVMSSNLLTELAGAHDEHEERKIPLVFLVGLAIGVVLTYILITK